MTKPHLILIHGYAETEFIFKHIGNTLLNNYNLWMPRLPGFDLMDEIQDYSIRAYAVWLAEFMDDNNIEKAHVAGHSFGGYISAQFAVLYPKRVERLSLIHSHLGADGLERINKRNDIAKAISKYGKKPFLKLFYSGLFAQENIDNNKDIIDKMFDLGMDIPDETLIELQYAMQKRADCVAQLATENFPIRFFAGAYDGLIPLAEIEEQVKKLPTATLQVEKVGHMGQFECPEALIKFLK